MPPLPPQPPPDASAKTKLDAKLKADQLQEEARTTMRNFYISVYHRAGDEIPLPPEPVSPMSGPPAPDGTSHPASGTGPPSVQPAHPSTGSNAIAAQAQSAANAPADNGIAAGSQGNRPGSDSASTQQAAGQPGTSPAALTPVSHPPGANPGISSPGVPGQGLGTPAPALSFDPEKSPNTVGGSLISSARNGAGAGRPASGVPGTPTARGAPKQDEEKSELKTKDYLVTTEHGEELIGPLPKAAPPVLGVWPTPAEAEHDSTP
jgi:hypothetical protein